MDKPPLAQSASNLLNSLDTDEDDEYILTDNIAASDMEELPIEHLFPNPDQPRQHFAEEALTELAQSIKRNGILQPILVRPHPFKSGSYEIIAGERRWQAAQKAGLLSVPIIIKDLSDADTVEIALIENVHRQDLNPIEEAAGYKQLIDEFDYTQDKLAEVVSKSRSHIANLIRLLTLPHGVKKYLVSGELSNGHARALIGLDKAESIAKLVVDKSLNVRQTERLAQAVQKDPQLRPEDALKLEEKQNASRTNKSSRPDPNIMVLQEQLSEMLGLKIAIKPSSKRQTGSVTIHYTSLVEFDRIRQCLEQIEH